MTRVKRPLAMKSIHDNGCGITDERAPATALCVVLPAYRSDTNRADISRRYLRKITGA